MNTLVSVVVPAFNQVDYLRQALRSALAQTHAHLEIIVVDDGSTDGTREMCESLGDPRVTHHFQENDGTKGIGARNAAMLRARGEWIALLDQDDLWAPAKIERQLAIASAHPQAGAVFCKVRFVDGHGRVTGRQTSPLPEGDVFHGLLASNPYHAVSGMFRRALLPQVGLPHAHVGLADHALWLSVARRAPVAVVDELLADYRVHEGGYQESQRRAGLLRLAHDGWQFNQFAASLAHVGCRACNRSLARGRRGAARSYLRALAAQWSAAQFSGSAATLCCLWMASPGWVLLPWKGLPWCLKLMLSAAQGVVRWVSGRQTR